MEYKIEIEEMIEEGKLPRNLDQKTMVLLGIVYSKAYIDGFDDGALNSQG